jgi:hypothetical protein
LSGAATLDEILAAIDELKRLARDGGDAEATMAGSRRPGRGGDGDDLSPELRAALKVRWAAHGSLRRTFGNDRAAFLRQSAKTAREMHLDPCAGRRVVASASDDALAAAYRALSAAEQRDFGDEASFIAYHKHAAAGHTSIVCKVAPQPFDRHEDVSVLSGVGDAALREEFRALDRDGRAEYGGDDVESEDAYCCFRRAYAAGQVSIVGPLPMAADAG